MTTCLTGVREPCNKFPKQFLFFSSFESITSWLIITLIVRHQSHTKKNFTWRFVFKYFTVWYHENKQTWKNQLTKPPLMNFCFCFSFLSLFLTLSPLSPLLSFSSLAQLPIVFFIEPCESVWAARECYRRFYCVFITNTRKLANIFFFATISSILRFEFRCFNKRKSRHD